MTKEELIAFEDEVAQLWEAGKINAPVHLCGGNEEQLIEIFKDIRRTDYVLSSHRNHYHYLLHDGSTSVLLREILGHPDASCRGRARSMGFIDKSRNFYSSAIVGGLCGMAVGLGVALKRKQEQDPLYGDECDFRPRVWCFIGDGAVDGGHFWESLAYAEGWSLPITFVIEDNDRATKTPIVPRTGPVLPAWQDMARRGNFTAGSKVKYYRYVPTYPHVGIGKYVQF